MLTCRNYLESRLALRKILTAPNASNSACSSSESGREEKSCMRAEIAVSAARIFASIICGSGSWIASCSASCQSMVIMERTSASESSGNSARGDCDCGSLNIKEELVTRVFTVKSQGNSSSKLLFSSKMTDGLKALTAWPRRAVPVLDSHLGGSLIKLTIPLLTLAPFSPITAFGGGFSEEHPSGFRQIDSSRR